MAAASSGKSTHSRPSALDVFSPGTRKQMETDDTMAQMTVSMIILAIVSFGLISMIVSLWLAL
ncbi:MAG: hypothetical protein MPJ50_17520 [Pirellulales bacterium]|nr:hypothetical protein [Pirellulales bacterium]